MTPSPLHTLVLAPSISRLAGGVYEPLWGYLRHLPPSSLHATIASITDPFTSTDTLPFQNLPNFHIHHFPSAGPKSFHYSPSMKRWLASNPQPTPHLIHVHSIRTWLGIAARRFAHHHRIPLLITPHGSLYPQLLQRSKWKKRLIAKLYDDASLHAASAFHATSTDELTQIRAYGLKQPVAVIPIGLDTSLYSCPKHLAQHWRSQHWPQTTNKKILLYLGLLEPKKGLLRLAQAWQSLSHKYPHWHLIIAGPNVMNHEPTVKQAFSSSLANQSVTFTGGIYHHDKHLLLASADLFTLPSDWESFGIVIAEALASQLPVIASTTAPWPQLQSLSCGWQIPPTSSHLTQTLDLALSLPTSQLQQMGAQGRQLISQHFHWPLCSSMMLQTYLWLTHQTPQPHFIHTT